MGSLVATEPAERAAQTNWWLLALLSTSCCINYIDRGNLSVAAPQLSRELSLDPAKLGLLLSAFFWTYASFQLIAGWLVDRFDVYRVFGVGFLLWSGATAVTGFAGSFAVLFGLRLVLGMGESIAYPAYSRIIASEIPERRRGLANALVGAGSQAGPALGTLIGGLIVAHYGWRWLFLILGFGAMLWLPLWFASTPRQQKRAAGVARQSGPGVLEIVRRRLFWGTFIGLFALDYALYFLIAWLPFYLVNARHYSLSRMAVIGSFPFASLALGSLFGGWASDRWIAAGSTPTRVRRFFAIAGQLGCLLLVPAALVESNRISMALMIGACLSLGLFLANIWAITQTLAGPVAAGRWTGFQNALGNLAGVVAPALTGWIVARTGSFFLAFAAVGGVLILGVLSYVFLVTEVSPVTWRTSTDARSSVTEPRP
jgi:ACS family D-galactonate transporter-like MFS transporter